MRFFLALLCGLLVVLALPPVSLFPLIVPAYGGLLWLLLRVKSRAQAFGIGWCFGLGYFTGGLYWFAYPLLIEPERFAWMIPFAVLGLPSVLAVYYGVGAALFYAVRSRWLAPSPSLLARARNSPLSLKGEGKESPLLSVLLFALIWLGVELLRGTLFTGFPWNLAAMSWTDSLPMLQALSLIGSYGYSFWTVLLAALPVAAFWPEPELAKKYRNPALALCLTMILLPYGFGLWRLEAYPTQASDTVVKLVQPSIPQAMKMDPRERIRRIEQHVALSRPLPGERRAEVILWSEAAYPYFFEEHSPPVNYIARELLEGNQVLVTGVDFYDRGSERITNSMAVIGADGGLKARYDKAKLVPFGEYAPLRWLLPIEKIVPGMHDFSAGEAGQVMVPVSGAPPFLPLICYEVIFPEMTRGEPRPEWLFNSTNDAWFGVSSGPYQHFEMSRMRAIEQGLPLVRVSNNGISAVIDPLGRVLSRLPLNKVGTITATLPLPLGNPPLYARF